MSNRRNLLLSIGAVLGVGFVSIRRADRWHGEILTAEAGGTGAPVERLSERFPVACTPGTVTAQQTEGPFYTPKTPHRRDIRDPDAQAPALVVTGRVLDLHCRPIAGAVLDFWQTGDDGNYDQHGYGYRGHQYTDSAGRFELVTVRPRSYTAMSALRCPHIHVKVRGRDTPLLTTQLYLPDEEEANARDNLYDPSLLIAYAGREDSARQAVFDFVLARS